MSLISGLLLSVWELYICVFEICLVVTYISVGYWKNELRIFSAEKL